ncbi:glycogen debranching N-terminal domain-containing protein [Arthrobacter sp. NPDC090010]|uniref:glycogen debranching N-terminal domain-containing protein n=1 Tax=Arthrobacter sp. NPDC090010 TaxID=3363942 RepID=UPI003812E3BE
MPETLQPFLSGLEAVFSAPTQAWSDPDGQIGAPDDERQTREGTMDGVLHSDVRVLSRARLTARDAVLEPAGSHRRADGAFVSVALLRSAALGDGTADPVVRLRRIRAVSAGRMTEELELSSATAQPVTVRLRLELAADLATMEEIKAGRRHPPLPAREGAAPNVLSWGDGVVEVGVQAAGADVDLSDPAAPALSWTLSARHGHPAVVRWSLDAEDAQQAVSGAERRISWAKAEERLSRTVPDPRLGRYLRRSLADLDGLHLQLPGRPECHFLAAGAPWFFTLFGRDSLWAARFLLPVDHEVALGTLRTLAAFQGTRQDPASQEEPGKIMHELRRAGLTLHDGAVSLPPVYYGTVDATPLWISLLHDAWEAGADQAGIRELLPAAVAAVRWVEAGLGDGFLSYEDTTGHGLANQGWKDSGDSVQFRDGRLAEAPIALSEVQAYAHEALLKGATLLEAFPEEELVSGEEAGRWRENARALARRFREAFWLEDERGPYVAIALDAAGNPVDSVTSNMGHLLGTGLLGREEERAVARRLVHPGMDSGFGLRTLAVESAGYWPLKYHGGSVWAHDTAIAIRGLLLAGRREEARTLAEGLLRAAESFDYRMPELHSGVGLDESDRALPYPAACRPQAWSAASAVVVAEALASELSRD